MKPIMLSAFITAAVSLWAIAPAGAWERSGSVTTARGTTTASASGGCAGGTCSRSASVTGPQGYGASRSGSVSASGNSSLSYGRTTTGPAGGSVTRSGSVSVSR